MSFVIIHSYSNYKNKQTKNSGINFIPNHLRFCEELFYKHIIHMVRFTNQFLNWKEMRKRGLTKFLFKSHPRTTSLTLSHALDLVFCKRDIPGRMMMMMILLLSIIFNINSTSWQSSECYLLIGSFYQRNM